MANKKTPLDATLLAIAKTHISDRLETLEARNSDSLDFFETSVWGIRKALAAAYEAGRADGARTQSRAARKAHKVLRSDGTIVSCTVPE